jgi:hypothetical protein
MTRRALALAATLLASTATAASGAVRASEPAPASDPGRASDHIAPLPIGTDTRGVFARLVHGDVVVTFKPAAAGRYRRIAGRNVQVGCVTIFRTTRSGAATEKVWAGGRLIAPRRRGPLRAFVGERGRRPDYCTVQLVRGRAEIAAVPVSARGAIYLDERRTVDDILGLLLLTQGASGNPTSPARMQTLSKGLVVPVSGPEQPPPAGHVAYWTDGTNEVYLGALTHFGTLFFYQYVISSDVVTTNMLDWLSGQNDP